MKRFLTLALVLSSFSVFALAGCEDTSTNKTKTESTGPGGKSSVESSTTVKESGSNPPPVEGAKPADAPK
jgi:hypothetical protein